MMEAHERRRSSRARLEPLFCNKYIDGMPYLAEVVDVSPTGILLRTTIEPVRQPDCFSGSFSIELDVPGNPIRLWLWGRTVRREGQYHAIELLGTELFDRASLAQLVRWRALS
jgi:hypothetical protein